MGAELLVRQAYARGFGLRRALLLGDLDEAGQAILQLRDGHGVDQYVVGHLAPDDRPDPTALGSLSQLDAVLTQMDVQEVVVAGSLSPDRLHTVIQSCFERGVALYVVPSLLEASRCRAEPFRVGKHVFLRLHPARTQMPELLIKRILDVAAASLMLCLLAPLILVIAIAIRLDSQGPVFFRQQRIGLGGRRFVMWKFRSMVADSERRRADLGSFSQYPDRRLFKMVNDPRITRVGRWLRRSSMDELPQLFNVLRGDMSLVGPRPPVPHEVVAYKPHHFERLSVVPGMTGPWQVGGRNLITDFEKVVQMEREYIRSWSLKVDARILLRTVRVVVTGEGAY
jgi:exopolysaccharide biosynthesis polyprenyl glycosylphosphotransferase